VSRWKAFGIHFSISLLAFFVILSVIIFVWYPGILFRVDGGWAGLRIVMGVDLVLGPLLTLIVFNTAKPSLKFDLSCIAALQLSCMAAGIWVVYQERPLALVLAYDTFYSLAAQEFKDFDKDPALLKQFPGGWPKMLYAELPADEAQAQVEYLRSQFIADEPLYMQVQRYQPIAAVENPETTVFRREQFVRSGLLDGLLEQINGDESCLLSKFVGAHQGGYVCYEPSHDRLRRFFEEQHRVAEIAGSD